MSWMFDVIPWWAWLLATGVGLALTYTLWMPLWGLLPSPAKIALLGALATIFAFIAGRNKGASGALQRAREKEQDRADTILSRGDEARARAERSARDGSLFDDDGWRRKDG